MTLLLVGGTAALAACLQSATGLGFALVLTPVLLVVLPPAGAVITVTLLGLELNLLMLTVERRHLAVDWRELRPILMAAVPGTIVGMLVLRALPRPVLQIIVGALVLLAAGARLQRARGNPVVPTGPGRALPRLGVGLTTGVLTTSSGVSGPPLALWLSHRGLSPGPLRDSLAAAFLALGTAGSLALIPLLGRARLSAADIGLGLVCVLAGHAWGSRLFHRLRPHHYEPILLGVVGAAGVASLVAGLGAAA